MMANISSMRAPRSWKGTPTASNSSFSQPAPVPNRKRPLETSWAVMIWRASSSGWFMGTMQMAVPIFSVVVAPAMAPSRKKGS